jgi:hypothetical protein
MYYEKGYESTTLLSFSRFFLVYFNQQVPRAMKVLARTNLAGERFYDLPFAVENMVLTISVL